MSDQHDTEPPSQRPTTPGEAPTFDEVPDTDPPPAQRWVTLGPYRFEVA